MRILYYLNFPTGGITRYTGEVLRAMPPEIECHVICPPSTDICVPGAMMHYQLMSSRRAGPLGRRLVFLWSQLQNPIRLMRLARAVRPDIIHFGDVNHLMYRCWRTRLRALGIPFALSVHDVTRHKAMVYQPWEDAQLGLIYKDAAILFVHSSAQSLHLVTFAGVDPTKIVIVPCGIFCYPNAERPIDVRRQLGIPAGAHVGLFFGDVRDDKGLERLIAAVAPLTDTHLIVAGRSRSRTHKSVIYYRKLAQALKVQARIHFVDSYIPEEMVSDYFRAADWCGLAYDRNFTSQSAVLCSAIYFETPVLVASAPTLVESAVHYGVGVAAADDSVEALTSAMLCLHSNNTRFDLGFDKYKQECTWHRNAQLTCKAYSGLRKRHG